LRKKSQERDMRKKKFVAWIEKKNEK